MSEQTIKLIQLLKEGKTCNEMCATLNLSNKQLFNNLTNLRNKGLLYRRKYYSNGAILYKAITTVQGINEYHNPPQNAIITANKDVNLRCIVISDLHFGNSLERIDLINRVYDYCTQNDIHIIFCAGDLIDGNFTNGEQKIDNVYEQIDHFIKNYPFDKSILTFAVGGDHDISALNKCGQSIVEATKNYRHDIIIGGYLSTNVNIKNDKISLSHAYTYDKSAAIAIQGHSHKYIAKLNDGPLLKLTVPSLSDINFSIPTAIEMELEFNKGYIRNVNLKQIYFGDKNYVLNEMFYELKDRNVTIGPILHEEAMRVESLDTPVKEEVTPIITPDIIPKEEKQINTQEDAPAENPKVLSKTDKPKNQIDRFYKKWGNH